MSKDWIFETLLSQGFPKLDAKIYVYLITEGPNDRKNMAQKLNLTRYELHQSLTNLIDTGIINEIPMHPALFSALSFDKVLEVLLETKKEQTKGLQERKEALLESWRTLTKEKKVA